MSWKRLFLSLVFLLSMQTMLIRTSEAGYFDPKLKWYTISTKHFNIHFHDGEEIVAPRMAQIAERVYARQTAKFQWKPWGRVEVVLTDTTDVSNGLTTTLPYNHIILFLATPTGDSTLNYYDDWLEDLFQHEFTHTEHLDMYGGIAKPFRWVLGRLITPNGLTPGWVREGIAVEQESWRGKGRANNSFSEMMLRTDILNNQFLAMDQMAGLQFDWPSFNAAYIYGGMFWNYLAEKYGEEKIIEFAHRYSNSMWLFSLNNKARKTYGNENFFKLHDEWKSFLSQKYNDQKAELEAKGLTNLQDLQHIKGSLENPALSPDGKYVVYSKTDVYSKSEIRRINVDGTGDELIYKGITGNQYSFSKDGTKLLFSTVGTYKHYYKYSEIYEIDLATKKLHEITHGQRAFHPDYSPDGKKIVFSENNVEGTKLMLWDVETKKATALTEAPFLQFSFPRFSPDGNTIAVSEWREGNRDIYLYDLSGKLVKQVTNDKFIDLYPNFSPDGKDLFFTSDRSGITNVYRYNLASGVTEQVSNVLTGLFNPHFTGDKMVVQNYYGRGYDLKTFSYTPQEIRPVAAQSSKKGKHRRGRREKSSEVAAKNTASENSSSTAVNPTVQPTSSSGQPYSDLDLPETKAPTKVSLSKDKTKDSELSIAPLPTPAPEEAPLDPALLGDLKPKKYNPFKKLFIPRYFQPNILFGDSILISLGTGASDPIGRHVWAGGVTYRTDANHLGGYFTYSYNRLQPSLFLNFFDFVVNYGDIFGTGSNFFEQRDRLSVGASIGTGMHSIAGYYFFEHRSADSAIPPGVILPPTLGNFSGFGMKYTFTRVSKYPASISLEGGPRIQIGVEGTSQALGSSPNNEQLIFSGDIREYVPLPMKNHVLAFRLAGGIAFGDTLLQGTFRLGSALGEGVLTGQTPRLYTLRGLPQITFAGERALLMSGEYRLPLVNPERGLGTGPIHLNKLYMVFFADYGSVFNGDIDFHNFLLGVGSELRGDFIIGYGLPITARIGYGIIVSGRQFIQGLTDPITGAAVKNGTVILQLGTSF